MKTPGRMPCDNEGRDWSDSSISQGMPEAPNARGEARNSPSLVPSEEAWPHQHHDLRLLAFRTLR